MILTGLLVGIFFGFVLQRGHLCATKAFRQVWVAKNMTCMAAFMLVIAIQAIAVTTPTQLGVIHLLWKLLLWFGVIVGGVLFGVSIVLADGCTAEAWSRSGKRLVGSWIALMFYAVGTAAMKYGALAGVNFTIRPLKAPLTTILAPGIPRGLPP